MDNNFGEKRKRKKGKGRKGKEGKSNGSEIALVCIRGNGNEKERKGDGSYPSNLSNFREIGILTKVFIKFFQLSFL